jgi:hypothetical protein
MADNDSNSRDKKKKEEFAEPQLELTLPGLKENSWFGQVVNSGLNVIGNVTGRKKSAGFIPTVEAPDEVASPQAKPRPKKTANEYNPTWGQGGKSPQIEYTNFSTAIGEFEKQQKVAPRGQVPFRTQPVNTGRSFLVKVMIMLVVALLAVGTVRFLDKKYNIRQLVKELRDPDKSKFLKKKKAPVVKED